MSGKPVNQDNLDDIYSDLSDNEEPVKKKNSSTSKQQPSVAIKMPSFLGGKAFIPPPPPPSSRPDPKNITTIPDQILQNKNQQSGIQGPNNQIQRERKSTIYVKNIPKGYNRQQTLTTFFRTYGNIKSIKTNDENHSATVRFQKEQDAFRFMMKKPPILNRSYIIYDTHQDFVVSPEIMAQRQKDQVVVVNSSEKQLIIMKENAESAIADKYRALLFVGKHPNWLTEQDQKQIDREMEKCRKIKQSDSSNQELAEMLANFENNFDWTLSYKVITKQPIEKKKVISLYNKYGPIGTITLKLAPLPTPAEQATDGTEDKLGIVKLKFLGVRSSWDMYFDHCESLNLEVEGNKLKNFYKSWFVKKKEQLKIESQKKQEELKIESQKQQEDLKNESQEQQKNQAQQQNQVPQPQAPNQVEPKEKIQPQQTNQPEPIDKIGETSKIQQPNP